jgi:PAS domain S-box-containing protein
MKHADFESRTMIPGDSLVPLESILCTEELNRRPSRPPDYQADKCALVALAQALADSPRTILQTMADKMLEVFQCDSAGFSLLTKDGKNFYWPAIAGMWQPHIGGGTPRNFGPCGDVLDCNRPLLFSHWERRYPYLLAAMPVAEQGLLVPFYVEGKAVGTIWAITHNDRRKFDAEDMRRLISLGSFASSAYQVVAFLDTLEERDEALQQSCEELEQRVKERTAKLSALNRELQAEVTERKITEEQLTKTEERLRDVIGNAPVILFSLDRFGVINLSEGKGLDAFGVKPGQLIGQSIFDLYHDSLDLHANARRALSGEEVTFVTEFNNQFFEIHLIPLLDNGGEVTGVTGVSFNITDRRRTERELRLVIDTIPAMSWSALADGARDYCSKGWVEYTGIKSREAVGSGWLKAYHPEDRDAHAAKWRASTKSGELFESEARILGVDGKYRWFLIQGLPLRDESGKISRWYGANVDIDERKRAEEALRDSEEQWKAAFESNPVMYFMVDRTGTTLSVNAFGAAQLDYKQSELVGQPLLNVFYEADREQVRKGVEYCFRNLGHTCKWEARKVRKDGTVIWVRETANALLLKNRPVLLVVCEDITDRKRAEEAVRRSEKELRDLIGTIPAMAFVTCADGSNEFVSQQWIEFSGLSGKQSRGDGWAATLHPEDREQHLAKWQAVQACGQPFESEARHRDAHGNYRWLLVRAVPLRSEQGKILKWYGTAIDIEARKRAEEALRASEQLARSHVEVMMRSLDVLATEDAPEKLIAEMLRIIGQRLRADSVTLFLRNPKDDSVHLRLVIEDGRQVTPHQNHPFVKDPHLWKRNLPFQEMLFTKGPVVCDDLEQDSRIGAELREYLMKRGRRRFLAIPMFVLGDVRGFIGIQHSEHGAYRAEEVELAQALAHHVMIATHEAELSEQRRHAVLLEERTRMARDIHDTLAQGFTGVIVQLEAMADAISRSRPEKVSKCLQRASDLARQSLSEARRSVHALRPQVLQKHNFWDALKDTIKNITADTALHTTFTAQGKLPDLPGLWQENVLRIGQEALTNTLKHAHARKFEARLTYKAKQLRLELCDDGDGFEVEDRHDGVGLAGMRERVKQMDGQLKITSARDRGTKIMVVLPCNRQLMP